jgi:hypothetical protein
MFQWYVITLFGLVVYVYAVEIERQNWSLVFAGLAFWGMDWFNEIWNGLVFHFTQYAPVWGAPGSTAYLILIGLNIEICFMFAIAGITFAKMLPADKKLKILGLPNRLVFAIAGSIFCVFVEVLLNQASALIIIIILVILFIRRRVCRRAVNRELDRSTGRGNHKPDIVDAFAGGVAQLGVHVPVVERHRISEQRCSLAHSLCNTR